MEERVYEVPEPDMTWDIIIGLIIAGVGTLL